METRVELTESMATRLMEARELAGLSQYHLADDLGWVRSKIKRIERAEVQTVGEEDLRRITKKLNVDFTKKAAAPKRRASPGPEPKKKAAAAPFKVEEVFSRVTQKRSETNLVYFQVTMRKEMDPMDLIGRDTKLGGVKGRINGVEHTKEQNPLKRGDRVVIMLFGMGIGGTRLSSRRVPASKTH